MASVRVRKRGKTFSYIFEAGKIDGKRKVVEKGGFATKAAAYKAGVEAYNDFLHGNIGITSESITLKDFMTSWLENVVALNVKPTSLQLYKSLANNQIFPHLGEVKVQDLTPAMMDKWLRNLQQKGLALNTLRRARTLVRQVLNYAVYPAQLISSNPVDYIKAPKNAPREIITRHVIMPAQFRALLEKYPKDTDYYVPLLILYHTGLRCGELLGLTWDNVDFEKRTVTVDKQLVYLYRRGYFFTTPKTPSSRRVISANESFISELAYWHERQLQNEATLGDVYVRAYRERNTGRLIYQSSGIALAIDVDEVLLVCTRRSGKPVLHHHISNLLKSEGLNAHSFRHTHATLLIENGAAPKSVASRLGHSDVSITQNLYTHMTERMIEETASIFGKIMQTNS